MEITGFRKLKAGSTDSSFMFINSSLYEKLKEHDIDVYYSDDEDNKKMVRKLIYYINRNSFKAEYENTETNNLSTTHSIDYIIGTGELYKIRMNGDSEDFTMIFMDENAKRYLEENIMTTEEIVEAIKVASCGTFISDSCRSTLMAWKKEYDENGRLVNCDPNYKDSIFNIRGKNYYVTRKEWRVVIWNGEGSYLSLLYPIDPRKILTEIDITPDYVRKYNDKKLKELLSKCEVKDLTLKEMLDMNLRYGGVRIENIFDENSTYKVWILIDEVENRVPRRISRIVKYERK